MIGPADTFRPRQLHPILPKLVWMRNIQGRRKRRLFADLIEAEDLGDLDDFVAAANEILECYRTVAGAKVNSEAETGAHWIGVGESLDRKISQTQALARFSGCRGAGKAARGRLDLNREQTSCGDVSRASEPCRCMIGESKRLNHFSSTSAGAIDGNRCVFTMRGSFTNSVFQPLWRSVPVNGGSPESFPTSRYSSGGIAGRYRDLCRLPRRRRWRRYESIPAGPAGIPDELPSRRHPPLNLRKM